MRLAKMGFYNGEPYAILRAPANIVMSIVNFIKFDSDYEMEDYHLNKSTEA